MADRDASPSPRQPPHPGDPLGAFGLGGARPAGVERTEEAPWLKEYWVYVKPVEMYNVLRLRARHQVRDAWRETDGEGARRAAAGEEARAQASDAVLVPSTSLPFLPLSFSRSS